MRSSLPIILVATGGALGALARYGLSYFNRAGALPIGTLLVNIVGCFIMGLLAWWLRRGIASPELRQFLGLGFLGALTTFSTFSYEVLVFCRDGNLLGGLWYTVLSTGGSLLAVLIGYVTARAIWV